METSTEYFSLTTIPSFQTFATKEPTSRCVNPLCELYGRVQYTSGRTACRRCKIDFPPKASREEKPATPSIIHFLAGRLPSSEKRTFGLRICELRLAKHLSQRELSAAMNTPRTYLSKVENGRCLPSLDQHVIMANALGMTLCEFIQETWGRIIYSPPSQP
jgi:DNA-binding XRE family transcriptional regulator